jgi:predicted nuclease of predicted toxin-antitoxin system
MDQLDFLADESCDFVVIRALRAAGYNVLAISEFMTRSDDRDLISRSAREQRILLTEDKDFGWLVYVSQVDSAGVILIRYPGSARRELAQVVLRLVENQGKDLVGAFCVLEPGFVRIRYRES